MKIGLRNTIKSAISYHFLMNSRLSTILTTHWPSTHCAVVGSSHLKKDAWNVRLNLSCLMCSHCRGRSNKQAWCPAWGPSLGASPPGWCPLLWGLCLQLGTWIETTSLISKDLAYHSNLPNVSSLCKVNPGDWETLRAAIFSRLAVSAILMTISVPQKNLLTLFTSDRELAGCLPDTVT